MNSDPYMKLLLFTKYTHNLLLLPCSAPSGPSEQRPLSQVTHVRTVCDSPMKIVLYMANPIIYHGSY